MDIELWERFIGATVILIFFASLSVTYAADEKARINLDVRYRWEYQDNFNQKYYGENLPKGDSDDGFLLQRIRFTSDLNPYTNIHLSLGIQDSRAYDVALPDDAFYKSELKLEHNPYEDHWELFNTYLELKNIFDRNLSIKGGRQTIAYGDKRVFGPGQWGNTGRYIWDAVKLSYKFSTNFMDIFYGKNIIHEPDKFSLYHRHFFQCLAVYSHFPLSVRGVKHHFEPFLIRKWDTHNTFKGENNLFGDFHSNYYGMRAYGEALFRVDYDFTIVLQRGKWGTDDVKTYGYHALIVYNLQNVQWSPKVSVEFSYASGDHDPTDGKRETFDGVFGARDKMYGRMNLMDWKNLQDAQVNLELKPLNNLRFKLEAHKFCLAERKDAWYLNPKIYRDKTGHSGRDLGMEFDLVAKYTPPVKGLEIQFGYGHFWPGKFVEKVADDVNANWYFLQMRYKFSKVLF